MARKPNETEDWVLSILYDHGATVFKAAADITACEWLQKNGYIIDYGGNAKSITSKGVRFLERKPATVCRTE
jgi:hypothetical protein